MTPASAGAAASRRALAPLLGELNDLKRVRAAGGGSVMATAFADSWAALAAGQAAEVVAFATTARVVAAGRLGAIDQAVLAAAGLLQADGLEVLRASIAEFSNVLGASLTGQLGGAVGDPLVAGPPPAFVAILADQPRAGATRPGRPRTVLEPPESHAEHCGAVAVYGVLLAADYGARPDHAFLLGLAHHLHNVVLPDAGFAGEELLGSRLPGIVQRLTEVQLATLPAALAATLRAVLPKLADAGTPEGRAFHAADVADRVLQMRHYARAAAFTVDQALDGLQLVHAGPVQAFHHQVLAELALA